MDRIFVVMGFLFISMGWTGNASAADLADGRYFVVEGEWSKSNWNFLDCVMDAQDCFWLAKENGYSTPNYRAVYDQNYCNQAGLRHACFGLN